MRAYPAATVVAEKFHAMTLLGLDNSRMKDFYDISMIASRFEIEPGLLARAIAATFERRRTPVPETQPPALSAGFAKDPRKQAQWAAFLRRNRLGDKKPALADIQAAIAKLVLPALELARKKPPELNK